MRRDFIFLWCGVLLLLVCGCCHDPGGQPPAVRPFQLERYLGVWHEAARMPFRFEKGMDRVTAEYTMDPSGTVRVVNRGYRNGQERSVRGIVRQKQPGTGELEVSFFRPFYGAYRIAALDPEYRAALVLSSGKPAWILVRDPDTAEFWTEKYIPLLKQWGYDCGKLEYPRMRK